MSGTDANLGELEAIASKLRSGSGQLEEGAAAPPAPDVGSSTQTVAGALAMLASNTANISEGMTAIGDAIRSSRDLYQDTDHSNAEDLHRRGPR